MKLINCIFISVILFLFGCSTDQGNTKRLDEIPLEPSGLLGPVTIEEVVLN